MMAIDNCCRKYRCTWLTTAKRYHQPNCCFSSKKVQIFSLCVSSNTTNLSLLIKIFGIQSNIFRYSFFLLCGEIFHHTAHCISQQRKQQKQVFCSFCLSGFFFFYSARKIPNQHQIFLFFECKTLRFIGDS